MFSLKHAVVAAALGLGLLAGAARAAPLEVYGRLPAIDGVAISPDGTNLALSATVGDDRVILVRQIGGPVLAQLPLGDKKVRDVSWADGDHLIIAISTTDVVTDVTTLGEQYQAMSLNIRTGKSTQLPTKSASHDAMLNVIWGTMRPAKIDGANTILAPIYVTIANNMQAKSGHLDLFSLNLENGIATRQQMGDLHTYAYLTRPDGSLVAKANVEQRERERDVVWTLQLRRGNAWQTVFTTNNAIDAPSLWGVSADGQSVIISTWDDKEKMWRPTPVNLADGKLGDYIGPAVAQGAVINDDGVVLGFTRMTNGLEDFDFVEPRIKAAWSAVRPAFAGKQLRLVSWTPNFSKLVVRAEGGTETGGFYLIDMVTKRADPIGAAYKVPANEVAEVKTVRYAAADGTQIEGFLTLPKGKPASGLPLIVLPHGGPRAADVYGFDWMAQGLASRGYAVLQPNFRGSTGYGTAFKEAGYGEWGAKMQTDLSDGVAYLADQRIVDPKRVCIMGASYGGYAALAGVTLQKGVYRCAVSVSGVADLVKMMKDDTVHYGGESAMLRDEKRLFGVETVSDPKVAARSPLQHAAAVDVPVLLIHGKDDTVVDYAQSSSMANALKSAGKTVEFVTLPGEDHWMSRSATRLQMLTSAVTFIEKNNPPN
jgi:dienelactone hydrolase